jgi:hypothetical protein
MATREIPRSEWPDFLDSFSRQHRGWLITIEVLDARVGAQVQVREQPLAGVTAEMRGGDASVSVLIGRAADVHLTHTIRDPAHIRLKETEAGAREALQIESEDGAMTLLRFRSVIPAELVDGVALE